MQVVFVDDESRVLAGIERTLVMRETDWACRFFTSAQAALEALDAEPADVVVSDMRIPFMDGATLLGAVRDRWPGTLRIILSGQCDAASTLRMLDVAHQFVSKPCDNEVLLAAVQAALSLRAMFRDTSVTDAIGRVNRLPSAPRVFAELNRLLADPASDTRDVARLLSSDPALGARIMQIAGSAYFTRGARIANIGDAIARLGIDQVRLLVLASQVFADAATDPVIDLLQSRALKASCLADRIAGDRSGSIAATAALLARIGLLLDPLRNDTMQKATTVCDTPLHAAIGGYLLGLWGLPMNIVEAVAHHTHPSRAAANGFGLVGTVHVAVALANGQTPDLAYLEQCGVLDQWPQWQACNASLTTDPAHD